MFGLGQLPEDEKSLITMITNFLVFALVSELIVLEPIHPLGSHLIVLKNFSFL